MKKFLKIVFCLLLIFSFSPREVKAEGTITNITIDPDGHATWDPYPGAVAYEFCAGVWIPNYHGQTVVEYKDMNRDGYGSTFCSFKDHLANISADSNNYYLMVWAYDENYELLATGVSDATYSYKALGEMPTPTLPAWYGWTIATWNGVEGADKYRVKIYRDGKLFDEIYVFDTSADLEYWMAGEEHQYYFTVSAMKYGYAESINAAKSPETPGFGRAIVRASGSDRYETSRNVAGYVRAILHEYTDFDTVFVATGNDYPDALSGAFFANYKNAPLLMINQKSSPDVVEFINGNLGAGGTVYVLGGTGVVKDEWLNGLDPSYKVKRLSGSSRYGTNLAILEEYMNTITYSSHTFMVCTGTGFADALSCSASDYPILLTGKALNADQKAWLSKLNKENTWFYIVGGTGAVSETVENELNNYGNVAFRLAGKNRYETSAMIADFNSGRNGRVVLATGKKAPDGLSAGPLAHSLAAPILLVDEGKTQDAFEYCDYPGIRVAYIVGGSGAVSDAAACAAIGISSLN
ncbi:MAG: cell wall-binding repeat-containing protein [Erysipelotrichaceae bacterium]|nr:cell wall-binding repeat-containing protein [Erysipelotrichaceae bacterium]